jgi:CRP-like cAMP-binding protein
MGMLQARKNVDDASFQNGLLSYLSDEGRSRVSQSLELVELETKQILYCPEQHITKIYFPEDCVIVMLTIMKNGATIESATVGREGASWISASFTSPTMPCQTTVAVPGLAYVLPSRVVEEELERNEGFHARVSDYSHALLLHGLRSTACNGLHSIEQRCTRWLLTTLDRTNLGKFSITHDFLAGLLGVRRSGISEVIEKFVADGTLENTRGNIRVLNRKRLEEVTCECYFIIREQFRKMKIRPESST